MNDSLFKLSSGDIKDLYKEMGSNEANISLMLSSVNELKRLIDKLQEEVVKLKLSAEVTKTKLIMYGSLGGIAYSTGLYFLKYLLSKLGVQ